MGETASSSTLAALDRSKRKVADKLRGPVSKRPSIEHENGTREEPTPSPTSVPTYCRECREPRRNFNMSGNGPGVVHIAAGLFHGAGLTTDNRILTWGQSERGQLGRESAWEGPPTQSGLNSREANGLPVSPDNFPTNTIFTQLACGEGTTFALTNTGDVYGWGSFRIFEREEVADGEYDETDLHKQFSEGVAIQHRPVKIPGVKYIKKIVCCENHVLALDTKGELYVWGFGDYG